ncbi:NtaA/DmoA family FMN-dependent monooxygenase [Hydrogenophaga sp.]|uniref:NtaA/DmoA family FMN-dependent monooxygenase n=1 Tax=Hydrogenophaga sp. TaxID=1904254 RepID=UPI002639259D|nr:NtaA/DmoA family FMN-dependent monooxygenase [Hydrogenophaga sp.]MCW5655487.1 NtaA/DmoA family FMN-dependent monooxygenase [Hydrogenophaga sp.]
MSGHLIAGLSLATTWLSGSAWRRADSQAERHHDVELYVELARRAEQACLHFVFRPDTVFLDPLSQAQGPGTSGLDPTLLLTCVARATRHIGLVTTLSTSFQEPFHIARSLESLQIISGGRAAWNLVTGLEGQHNFGHRPFLEASGRYRQAEESLRVVQALLRSYPAEALRLDRESGQYADVQAIRPIDHQGPHFQVQGPLTLAAGRFGPLPVFQAGASADGRAFAARHADAVFAATPTVEAACELRQALRQAAAQFGRPQRDIRVLPGLSLYLAHTRDEAQALFEQSHAHLGRAQRLAKLAATLGIAVEGLPTDRRLGPDDFPAPAQAVRSRTHAELLRRRIASDRPTLDALLSSPEVVSSAHWQVVGTPDDAVEQILAWQVAGAIDGVIALPGGSLGSLGLFIDEVVPALQRAGSLRTAFAKGGLMAQLQAA